MESIASTFADNTKSKSKSKKSSSRGNVAIMRSHSGPGYTLPLPLLEGLSHRSGAADAIVEEAFQRFAAGSRIATWLSRVQRLPPRPPPSTRQETTSTNVGAVSLCSSPLPSSSQRKQSATTTTARSLKRRKLQDSPEKTVMVTAARVQDAASVHESTFSLGSPRSNTKRMHRSICCSHHWLIQGLASSSLRERQVACRILAQGCSLEQHRQWQVVELLVSLLDRSIESNSGSNSCSNYYKNTQFIWSNSGVTAHEALVSPDVATIGLGWIALLKHVVLYSSVATSALPSGTSTTTSKAGTTATSSHSSTSGSGGGLFDLAFAVHRRYGLRWLCSTIWKLALQLQQPHHHQQHPQSPPHSQQSSSSSQSSPVMQHHPFPGSSHMSMARVTAIQKLILALVDLVYCLTLSGNGGHTDQGCRDKAFVLKTAYQYLWSSPPLQATALSTSTRPGPSHAEKSWWSSVSNAVPSQPAPASALMSLSPPLSPLACLVGAHHLLKQLTDPFSVRTRAMDACLSILQQLVDPSSIPKVIKQVTAPPSLPPPPPLEEVGTSSHKKASSSSSVTRQVPPNRLVATFVSTTTGANAASSSGSSASAPTRRTSNNATGSSSTATGATGGNTDRSAAAAVARMFSAVYGGDQKEEDEEEDEEDHDDDDEGSGEDVIMDHDDDEIDDDEDDDDDDDEDEEGHDDMDIDGGITAPLLEQEQSQPTTGTANTTTGASATNASGVSDALGHHINDDDDDDDDDDEEIDSDDVDDDDDCGGEDACDDEEEDEHDIVIHDDEVARLEDGFLELNEEGEAQVVDLAADEVHALAASSSVSGATAPLESNGASTALGATNSNAKSSGASSTGQSHNANQVQERKRSYIKASMEVLALQLPLARGPSSSQQQLPLSAEQGIVTSIMNVVKPPKKPLNTKIILRRAPTQEEFFRGSLSKNPVSLNMLKSAASTRRNAASSSSNAQDTTYEPTVGDLRQYIANDLQMAESAELLELMVANKILDIDLKLRVVHQVLWKTHLMENTSSTALSSFFSRASSSALAGRGGAPSFFSTGTGLSMIFSSSFGVGGGGGAADRTRSSGRTGGSSNSALGLTSASADTPLSALPPMVVTYRLTGVDGEATEDTVSALADPEAPEDAGGSPEERERLLERDYGLTRLVTNLPQSMAVVPLGGGDPQTQQNQHEANGRGVSVLLLSVERHITDTLRRIRRDDVGLIKSAGTAGRCARSSNQSRERFKQASPYPGLTLLWCCSKLPINRKLLLQSRAPTVLLKLLLDVMHSFEEEGGSAESQDSLLESTNATAKVLQELIEVLASDISSAEGADKVVFNDSDREAKEDVAESQDASTLRLLLESIETISLSRPLRNVIAKLLPYLTYGQVALSKELALDFARHVSVDYLDDNDGQEKGGEAFVVRLSTATSASSSTSIASSAATAHRQSVLMDTFVHASISLPKNEVCNSLRLALLECGYVERIVTFLLRSIPLEPPPWSTSLWSKEQKLEEEHADGDSRKTQRFHDLETQWREYINRQGLRTALDMLIGLSKNHVPTQQYLADVKSSNSSVSEATVPFLSACHWLEATSDHTNAGIHMNRLGLVSETLLDELDESQDSVGVAQKVRALRRTTRERKREIAMARRSKTLNKMNSFGPSAGSAASTASSGSVKEGTASTTRSSVRETAASILAPVFGLFQNSAASLAASSTATASEPSSAVSGLSSKRQKAKGSDFPSSSKPAWMSEMEGMEDETGLTCAVCQEGRNLQPSELLGLYAYLKKVAVPVNQCGGRANIDGTALLAALPSSLPDSLLGTHAATEWYPAGKAAGEDLRESSRSSSLASSSTVASNRRATYFTTTVSAGNSIHFSCHIKARNADRSHPKAPKSEWEGASLRNSRVNCNVILPLVSSRSSKVPLVAVDVALTDHQTAVSNLLGARPKSMLWTVLHDVRFLLLRMAYGEALNADCGGGSLASNAKLVFYQLFMADMFEKDAQVDAAETAQHARALSAGFLAACAMLKSEDDDDDHRSSENKKTSANTPLLRGIADAAPMAALTCILFHNTKSDINSGETAKMSLDEDQEQQPHAKRRWVFGKESFLRGLLRSAGRRHALGVDTSGCVTGRGGSSGQSRISRSSAFADWEVVDGELSPPAADSGSSALLSCIRGSNKSSLKRNLKPCIDDFRDALRPMVVYYAIMDQLSSEFVLNMEDSKVEESANKLVDVIENCQRAQSIQELLRRANVALGQDEIIDELQRGMISA
jgi:hypothetical protein